MHTYIHTYIHTHTHTHTHTYMHTYTSHQNTNTQHAHVPIKNTPLQVETIIAAIRARLNGDTDQM